MFSTGINTREDKSKDTSPCVKDNLELSRDCVSVVWTKRRVVSCNLISVVDIGVRQGP